MLMKDDLAGVQRGLYRWGYIWGHKYGIQAQSPDTIRVLASFYARIYVKIYLKCMIGLSTTLVLSLMHKGQANKDILRNK